MAPAPGPWGFPRSIGEKVAKVRELVEQILVPACALADEAMEQLRAMQDLGLDDRGVHLELYLVPL
jgi:hypothetical protein